MALQESNYTHRHASNQKVLFKKQHGFFVYAPLKRYFLIKAIPDILYQGLLTQCPAEFFEIKGIHPDMPFL